MKNTLLHGIFHSQTAVAWLVLVAAAFLQGCTPDAGAPVQSSAESGEVGEGRESEAQVHSSSIVAVKEHHRYRKVTRQGERVGMSEMDFSCVEDLQSGLVWEVKSTVETSEAYYQQKFRWGGTGAEAIGEIFFQDWDALLAEINSQSLCGYQDWRMPTIAELQSLVMLDQAEIKIHRDFFPHTVPAVYWSASAYDYYKEHAQTVNFADGTSAYYNGYRGERAYIRLVRHSSAGAAP
ncbi:hypothetical protein TDB9533_03867 [Thalassocella blandensis]|nr:hypothetical protein TDB9533_03867 [Thalassocella blandensis]